METFGDLNFSGTAKTLLNKLRAKDITEQEFLTECAFWAIKDGFDELRPKSLPTAPRTQAFSEYENLTPEKKSKVDGQFFVKNPEINAYYSQINFIRNRNRGNYDWLKTIKSCLPEEDIVLRQKVENRLAEFENWVNAENDLVDKAKEIFEGAEV